MSSYATDVTPVTPACDGEYETFYALIDAPGNRWVRREAANFCEDCPIVATCIPEYLARGGEDAAWAYAIATEIKRRQKAAA